MVHQRRDRGPEGLATTTRGGQPRHSGLAIATALTLRAVFRLALRQIEGLIGSIIALLGTQRERHLRAIGEHGRTGRQAASGYNWRALVEADVSRFKRVIGDALRSRTDRGRATGVAIAVAALNHMLELGRPEYVRTA